MTLNDIGIWLEIGGFLFAGYFAVIIFDKELSGSKIDNWRSRFEKFAQKLDVLKDKIKMPKGWPSATIVSAVFVISIVSVFTPSLNDISPLFRLIGSIITFILLLIIILGFFFDKEVKQTLTIEKTNKGWYPLILVLYLLVWCLYPLVMAVIGFLKAMFKVLSLAGKTLSLTHGIKLLCLSTGSAAIIAGLIIELITN